MDKNKLRLAGIICILILVMSALITTGVVSVLGVGTVAAIDATAVLAGISGIGALASGLDIEDKKGGDNE